MTARWIALLALDVLVVLVMCAVGILAGSVLA